MSNIILSASNISKSFNENIFSNIEILIKEGETHVIMGKSGVGKSTLLKILAGLIPTDSGAVYFEGEKLENPDEMLVAGHEELAYVAQNFNLLHNRTVYENLKDALLSFKDDFAQDQIKQLLQLMRLDKIKDQKIEQLSGGEKQRLAIARALSTQPAVLLLDEPFTQLDFPTRQVLLDAIKEVNIELQTTILLVSHNLYEAFYLADKIHILHKGAIIRSDVPEEIYENPQYQSVAEILGEVNIIPKQFLEKSQHKVLGIWSENLTIESGRQQKSKYCVDLKLKNKLFLGNQYRYQFKLKNGYDLILKSDITDLKEGELYSVGIPQKYLFEINEII